MTLSVVAALHLSEPSGPSRSIGPVLERCSERGAEVTVAVPAPGGAAQELAHAAHVVVTGHEPLTFPRRPREAAQIVRQAGADARRFRALLREVRADVAIVATTSLPALTLAARTERVPVVLYAAELYRHSGARGPRSWATLAAVRANARMATVAVGCSQYVVDHLPRGTPSVVVYPAIDPAVADGDAEAFRRRHAIPTSGPCLATLGNVSPGRAQDVAIAVVAELRRDRPDARLVIAGAPHPRAADVAYAAELQRVAARLGVGGAVHLVGFERTADVLAAADLLLNPARVTETFGIASAEALAAGVPVVSTDVGAIPEVLHDGEHALLVPPGDVGAMAAATRRMLDDDVLRERLVDRGREHVRSEFSATRQLPRFDAAIAMALRER